MRPTCSLLACACWALVACAQPASPTGPTPSAATAEATPSTPSPAPTQKKMADDGDNAGGMIGLVNPSPGCDPNAPLGPNGKPWESDHCDAGAAPKMPPKKSK